MHVVYGECFSSFTPWTMQHIIVRKKIWLCKALHNPWPSHTVIHEKNEGGGGVTGCFDYGFLVQKKLFIIHHVSFRKKRHHLKVWRAVLVDQCCLDVYLQFTVFMKCWQVPTVTDCALKLPCTGAFVKQGDRPFCHYYHVLFFNF